MQNVIPPQLEKGSVIRLVATARYVNDDMVKQAERWLESEGFEVQRGENLMAQHFQFAGTDAQRRADMQDAMNDQDVGAIFIMRGGYGSHRVLNDLDFSRVRSHPKWLVGFSDVTAIHGLFQNHNVASIHSAMPSTYSTTSESARSEILACLRKGKGIDWTLEKHPQSISGTAKGRLVGGNLSVLASVIGTECFPVQEGDILVIEDLDEMLYHLDRIMLQLSRSGVLSKLSGLIVGGFSAMRDNTKVFGFSSDNPFGMSAEEIILSYLSPLGIPVMIGAPVGHIENNRPLVLGTQVTLNIKETRTSLSY